MAFNRFRDNFRRFPRQMHKITCSDCGKEAEVPFKPKEGLPVYCRECFMKRKGITPREREKKEEAEKEIEEVEEREEKEEKPKKKKEAEEKPRKKKEAKKATEEEIEEDMEE